MALLAGGCGVDSEQRKPGQVVFEKDTFRPTFRVVALLTTLSLLACVHIVSGMTVLAGPGDFRLFEDARMASQATDGAVGSVQGEYRLSVIKLFVLPRFLAVTLDTVLAKASFVLIIGPVACGAASFQLVLN